MKKVFKYMVNILCIVSALVTGFNSIEGIVIPYAHQIVEGIGVITGVIGTYLIGNKVISK